MSSIEGHLGAALDGDLLVSVDKACPGVVVEEKDGHVLVDEGAFLHSQMTVAVVTVAVRPGGLEDAGDGDLELAVPGKRWIAQLLVDVVGNVDLCEVANAADGPALVKLLLGGGVDELLALLLRQHEFLYLERRRVESLAAEIFLPPVDALAILAELERGREDGRYGGGAGEEEEERSSDREIHCACAVCYVRRRRQLSNTRGKILDDGGGTRGKEVDK